MYDNDNDNDNDNDWRWRATRTSAGLCLVRLHDLRHFYASGLIAAGCDVVTVQRGAGTLIRHDDLEHLQPLWPTAEDRTRQAAAGLMREAVNSAQRVHARAPG